MAEKTYATYICSVVFLDIVSYSKLPNRDQILLKLQLNDTITDALRGTDPKGRLLLDTGDGAALGFLMNPQEALVFNRRLRQLNRAHPRPLDLRMGINLGPVTVIDDLNRQHNMVGDGINVAQRIMSFAARDEILVSRSFHDAVIQISQEYVGAFSTPKESADKHGRKHDYYRFVEPGDDPVTVALPPPAPTAQAAVGPGVKRGAGWVAKLTLAVLGVGAVGLLFWLGIWARRQMDTSSAPPAPAPVAPAAAPAVAQPPAYSVPPLTAAPAAPAPSAQPGQAIQPNPTPTPGAASTALTQRPTTVPVPSPAVRLPAPTPVEADAGAGRALAPVSPSATAPATQLAPTPGPTHPEPVRTPVAATPQADPDGDGALALRCPTCNCSELLIKASMGIDPLTRAEKVFFRRRCR